MKIISALIPIRAALLATCALLFGAVPAFATSSNADLSNLVLSSGTLNPVFASGTTSYTAGVLNSIGIVTVTPTLADATATVKVNDVTVASGAASGVITLAVGSNTITTVVTAQDGVTTKTYTVTVTLGGTRYFAPLHAASEVGTFSSAASWLDDNFNPTTPPTALDFAVFNTLAFGGSTLQQSSTVNFSASAVSGDMTFFGQTSLNLGGNIYTVSRSTNIRQTSAAPALTLNNGTLVTDTFNISSAVPSSTVTVAADASLQITDTGTFIGGVLRNATQMTVNGSVSTLPGVLFAVGLDSGTSVLTISGATASASLSFLGIAEDGNGDSIGGTGQVNVSNGGALTASNAGSGIVLVGRFGAGGLAVNTGGHVVSDTLSVGRAATRGVGTVTLDGEGSKIDVTNTAAGSCRVGRDGTGTLLIRNGGDMTTTSMEIGFTAGAVGSVTVTGAGSTLTASQIIGVGGSTAASGGTGTLTAALGGIVATTDAIKVWDGGTLTLDGGTITTTGGFTLTSADVKGAGTLNGNITSTGTTYAPGTASAAGLITVSGSLGLSAIDSVAMDLGGSGSASFDRFSVSGGVTLGGATLTLNLLPGFSAAINDTLVLIDNTGSSPISGQFAGIAEGATITVGTTQFRASYVGGTGNDFVLTVVGSTNANLTSLVPSAGTLSPAFAANTFSYTATVPNAVASITMTPTKADINASVLVRVTPPSGPTGNFVSAGSSLALGVGSNTIDVKVTAQDGTTTQTNTLAVTRTALSSNADLSALALNGASLSSSFTSGNTSYTASVPFATTSVTVTPTVAEAFATVAVNGSPLASGSTSGTINLTPGGITTITTVVTAQSGATNLYTITVTRAAASTNANLSNLVLSAGTLTPTFASSTLGYTTSVPNTTTSITLTPTVADATATIKVNNATVASGSASGAISLAVGANIINTVVAAQDGSTTKLYTVTVTRAAITNGFAFFSSSTDTIALAGNTTLNTTATFEAVVALTQANVAFLFLEQVDSLEHKDFRVGTTGMGGTLYPGTTIGNRDADVAIAPNVFHHLAYVRDVTEERFYLDGVRVATHAVSGSIANSPQQGGQHPPASIGGARFDNSSVVPGLLGLVDSFRISNVARYSGNSFTPPGGDLPTDANTLVLFNFNPAEITVTSGVTTIADLSGNGHTGTFGTGFTGATTPTIVTNPNTLREIYTFTIDDGSSDTPATTTKRLDGQDNWKTFTASDATAAQVSKGRATAKFGTDIFVTRANDANFSFNTFSGTETNAIIQADITVPHLNTGSNVGGEIGIGADTSDDADTFYSRDPEGTFFFGMFADNGNSTPSFDLRGSRAAVPDAAGDILQMQVRIDFTANANNGSGSLFYRNLTRGETAFHAVSGVQNVNLAIQAKLPENRNPAHWNAFALRPSSNDVFIDNFTTVGAPSPTPSLSAPLSGSFKKTTVPVTFSLPEAALAGSVQLTFDNGLTLARTLTLATSQLTAGAHSLTLPVGNLASPAEVASVSGGTTLPDGTYTVTLSYRNAAARGAATATATTVVIDNTPPIISGPFTPLTLTTGVAGTSGLPDYTSQAITSDNFGVTSVTQSPAAGPVGVGTTHVTLTAQDAAGNSANTSFDVTVLDGTPPTVSGTFTPLTLTTGAGGTAALPDYSGQATTSDNVGVTSVTQSPASGPVSAGTTHVTLTAGDAAGNTASASFDVTVNDGTPPTISGTFTPVTLLTGAGGTATLPDYTTQATKSDNVGVTSVTQSPAPGPVSAGVSHVTLTAHDAAGNTASTSFDVTVNDGTSPAINGTFTPLTLTTGADGTAALPDYLGQATITDNVGVTSVTQAPAPGPVSAGVTQVTLTARDAAGNVTNTAFDVNVLDGTTPVLTVPALPVTASTTSPTGTVVTFSVRATDLVSGPLVPVANPASGSVFPLGNTTVNVTATDAAGNVAQANFTVTVTGLPDIAIEQPEGAAITSGDSRAIGSVIVGGSVGSVFTLNNAGAADLSDLLFTIDGPDAAMFTLVPTPPTLIIPGGATTFTIQFAPTSAGTRTAALHITSNDPDENPFDIALTGTALSTGIGDVEASFAPGIIGTSVTVAMPQPDGKILLAGTFSQVGGQARSNVVRILADGSVDPNFAVGAGVTGSLVNSMALQSDGKILIGGLFTTVSGTARTNIARLNSDFSLDTTFDPGTGPNAIVSSMALQPDGKVLIGGQFTTVNGSTRTRIARLNADGSVDLAFDAGPVSASLLGLALQPDGKIVIGGLFTSINGTPRNRIARLTATGAVDATFDPGTGTNNSVNVIALQPDGKMVIGGVFATVNGISRNNIARLESTGALDATFNPGTDGTVRTITAQTDGKLLIGGLFTSVATILHPRLARVTAAGELDLSFDPGSGPNNSVQSVVPQADGKVLVAGQFSSVNGISRNLLVRLSNNAASESLTVPAATRVQWLRSGSSPEVASVDFEQSTDAGLTWTSLGSGTRIAGGWERTGLSLGIGTIRARGQRQGGIYGGSGGLVESTTAFSFPTPIQAWRQQFFGSVANTGNGADTSDFDHDGVTNLVEFAFGLDPLHNSAGQLPQPQIIAGNLVLSFTRPAGVSGITYQGEFSTTMKADDWHPVSDTGTGSQHTFSVPMVPARTFLRVKVTSQP